MEEQIQHKNFHDKYYKLLLIIPVIVLILSFIQIGVTYSKTGDFMQKDISLTGGTSATISGSMDADQIKNDLSGKLEDVNTRSIYDLITREQKALVIETKTSGDETKKVLEDYLGYELTSENSSFEFTGSSLSDSFYRQLLIAIVIAFVLMAGVVFIIFRTFIPSLAVISCAFADILTTLAICNLLGMKISSAGIVAFLMLIGYSVDTDILLTTRLLKRTEGTVNHRLFGAFKTGMTMTLTSLLAIIAALIIVQPFSATLAQMFTILSIGLMFDMFNTWVTNVSIIKWYVEKKKDKSDGYAMEKKDVI